MPYRCPGDGIGLEVIPAALRTLTLLTEEMRLDLDWEIFDWGARRWRAEGVGIPDGAIGRLAREYRAILFGALGDRRISDMAHGRAILLGLRTGLDLYVNYRPLFLPGATVDLYRENTEGLYAGVGGTMADTAVDTCVYTRQTVERFVRYCLRDLSGKGRRRVTLVHKANAVPHTGRLWQQVFHAELVAFPELTAAEEYVDSFCYHNVDCSLPETDFAAYARSLGAMGITVRRADDLDGSLAAALRATGPVVVDVHIDPRAGAPTAGRNAGLLRDSAVGGTR